MNPNDYSVISLFGLEMNPPRSIPISGSFSIYFYGIIIALGLMMAVMYGWKRCRQFGFSQDDLTDGILCIVPISVLCARFYYCIFRWELYKDDLLSIFAFRDGGLAIYGGVIAAAISIVVFCRIKKIKVGAVLDLVALGFLIGQSIGRWGNFFNREAVGAPTEIFTKMGLWNIYSNCWEYFHPTFLYESVWNLIGFVLLHFLSKKRKYDGQIALGYAAWYGFGRTFIEGLREDSLYIGTFRVSQMVAAISCFAAVALLMYFSFKTHDPAKLQVNLFAAKEAAKAAEEAEEEDDEETEEVEEVEETEKTE